MKIKCIVPKCLSNDFKNTFPTFPFPKITYNKVNQNQPNLVSLRRRRLWLEACNLPDDYDIEATEPRICYRHFINEKPSKKMEMNDPDWVPSLNLNGEFGEHELELENETLNTNEEENKKNKNRSNDQSPSQDNEMVSYFSLEEESELNQNECTTMIYDEETGNVTIVKEKTPEKQNSPQIKSPIKRKSNETKSLSDKKKPKILNRYAPQPQDSEDEETPKTNDQSCQTVLTMDRIKEMEDFWNENSKPTRKSLRSRKQRL